MKAKQFAYLLLLASMALVVVVSCSKDFKTSYQSQLNLPDQPYEYNMGNRNEVVELGRVLFYDKSLSLNSSVSCGSCHKQALAFADDSRFSTGVHNAKTLRNSPTIQNLAGSGAVLFWDGREHNLQEMVTQPIFEHMEMATFNPKQLVDKVKSQSYYAQLFAEAYPDSEINMTNISNSLRWFVSAIESRGSKFDRISFRGGDEFDALELKGRNLFFGTYDCGSCHALDNPAGYSTGFDDVVNIGLDKNYQDQGAGAVTGLEKDNGKFKIPNLRNIELTAPYMHDGRFANLNEVLEHYSSGVKHHDNLDSRLKDPFTGKPLVLNIPEQDKQALIAFMKTLTDYDLISDVRFSDPFTYN